MLYAIDNYLYKSSATKSIFLADLRLINNFENYYNKYYYKSPHLIYNQINIIVNLFTKDVAIILLKYKLGDNFNKISQILENVQE